MIQRFQFVRFEGKDGNDKAVAVFHDPMRFGGNGRVAFDLKNLQLRIANLKKQVPGYDLSSEMAVLVEMKKGSNDRRKGTE